MTQPKSSSPRSAGAFIPLGVLAGIGLGLYFGQPSLGMVSGFGLGLLVTVLFWLFDRRR